MDRYVEVKVIDTGIGISLNDQTKLFKIFGCVQSIRNTMNTQGIGMGLHISKSIVEQFGGKVKVESEHGIGSTFSFTFKLSKEEN